MRHDVVGVPDRQAEARRLRPRPPQPLPRPLAQPEKDAQQIGLGVGRRSERLLFGDGRRLRGRPHRRFVLAQRLAEQRPAAPPEGQPRPLRAQSDEVADPRDAEIVEADLGRHRRSSRQQQDRQRLQEGRLRSREDVVQAVGADDARRHPADQLVACYADRRPEAQPIGHLAADAGGGVRRVAVQPPRAGQIEEGAPG